MARNAVAANLVMATLIIGGFITLMNIKREVFPEFELDLIQILVPYPGASPAEVEQGVILAVEEAVRGLDGVKRVRSRAFEGSGFVQVELLLGSDANKVSQDVKNAIDRIRSFPDDAERPIVSLLTNRLEVVALVIYGDQEELVLRKLAERARDDLLQLPEITVVELAGARPLEISIEVAQADLRTYRLTLEGIAREVARAAVELPGGGVKTEGGEILLRTAERRDFGSEFADILLLSTPDGTEVRLGDIATIVDGFEDTDEAAFYNGKPAVMLKVFRTGEQTPTDIAEIVHAYIAELEASLPPGVDVGIVEDFSEIYRDRIRLLLRNAALGLVLVLGILGLFLQVRLAFWVTMGIPISMLGALLLMPGLDVSINMISLFAFITTLGIVVDDAIIVGENVFEMRQRGVPFLEASIMGAHQVALPVVFSILTNIAAFMPLFFVPGVMGKMFRTVPSIVVPVFTISLLESLFVLPAHLGHLRERSRETGFSSALRRQRQRFNRFLQWLIHGLYKPLLQLALGHRYLTLATGATVLLLSVGLVVGGRIEFSFMPRIESDMVTANAVLPYGSPIEDTKAVQARLLETAREILAEHGGEKITRGIFLQLGGLPIDSGPMGQRLAVTGSHLTNAQVFMVPTDQRDITAMELANEWRDRVGEIAGVESLTFVYSLGPHAGAAAIDIELSHPDLDVLDRAGSELAQVLKTYKGVRDIDDGFTAGKPQLDFKIRPEARSLGITAVDLGRQVRSAFYGAEAIRQQRGRDEVKVMVRLPEADRKSEFNIEELLVRTPRYGGEIPLTEAAEVERGRAYTEIKRADGRRVINVTADVVPGVANANTLLADIRRDELPELMARYPGLRYSLEGEQREQVETMGYLVRGFILALVVIFAMLAIPLGSYVQPLVIMVAIPFGFVGAVVGHMIMGYELNIISGMGVVALSGVVVNDSLVLLHAVREGRDGLSPFDACVAAGVRRFRPVILTSLTTFFGLAPMIFETSMQARFLIPMAIALGYGILFATVISLLLVPALYLIVEDIRRLFGLGKEKAPS